MSRFYYSPANRKTSGATNSLYVFYNHSTKRKYLGIKSISEEQKQQIKELLSQGFKTKDILVELGLDKEYTDTINSIKQSPRSLNKSAKDLTEDDVLAMRQLYENDGLSLGEIHKKYEFLSRYCVQQILRYAVRKWQHIEVKNPKIKVYKHFDYKPKPQ